MMIKIFTSELRKLLSMRICAAVVLLLALNLISLHITAGDSAAKYERLDPYREVFAELEKVCSEDPEYYIAYCNELKEEYDRQKREWEFSEEAMFAPIGADGQPIDLKFQFNSPSTLVEGYEDHEIINLYIEYSSEFTTHLGESVENAQKNLDMLDRFGLAADTPTSEYQHKLIDLYSRILEGADASASVVIGWEELLNYENGLIFLFIGAILLAVQIGFADRESGVESLLRTCRRGRIMPALAKCGTIAVAVAGMAILLNLTEILYIGLRFGLSLPTRSIQNIEAYVYSPYTISILEALLLNLIGMVLSAALLGALALLLTAITRQVILPLIVSGLVMVANLLLHWILLFGDWRIFNIFELSSGSLLKRPPAIALSSLGNSLYPLEIALFGGMLLIICAGAMITYYLRRPTARVARSFDWNRLTERFRRKALQTKRLKVRRPSLIRGELRKCLSPMLIVAILLLVGVRVQQATERFEVSANDVETRKRDYAEKYGGVLTEESAARVHDEYNSAVALIDEELQEENSLAYALGEMSADEYYGYLNEVWKATSALPVLSEVNSHITYLENKADETGLQMQFFYDGGYEDFFGIEFDLSLYLIVLLGLSAIFAKEYVSDSSHGGFVQILRTTQQGRIPVFARKLIYSAVYSGMFVLAFSLLDLYLLGKGEGLHSLSAPLMSMQRYADVSFGITVGGYLVLCIFLRLLGALILALLTTALSCLIRNTKLVLALTAAITLLPYALYYFGIELARYFDFTTLLSGDRLWRLSWELGNIVLLAVFVLAAIGSVFGLTAAAYQKFCK